MRSLSITLTLESDLGTPLRGDTLFGQLCWAMRARHGEDALRNALEGYTAGSPWLIVSDAFPSGMLPRPELPPPPPGRGEIADDNAWDRRKAWSRCTFLPASSVVGQPLIRALTAGPKGAGGHQTYLQPHNTINRISGTTGKEAFAPYQMERLAASGEKVDLVLLHDPDRVCEDDVFLLLQDIGATGFGRDASIGLGRWRIDATRPSNPVEVKPGQPCMTLAPCIPSVDIDPGQSFWRPFTRFGRHGGEAARGLVFKAPVLMADTAAVLAPAAGSALGSFAGVGVGGGGRISRAVPATVQQGYAPLVPLDLDGWEV